MSNYPDNMNWQAYDAIYAEPPSYNTPSEDEIEKLCSQVAETAAFFFMSDCKKLGVKAVDSFAQIRAVLAEVFTDQLYDAIKASRAERGE